MHKHVLQGEGPFVPAAQLAYTQNNHTETEETPTPNRALSSKGRDYYEAEYDRVWSGTIQVTLNAVVQGSEFQEDFFFFYSNRTRKKSRIGSTW